MSTVSDIKLIRTDTTLDLSHEAEKRYRSILYAIVFYKNMHLLHVVLHHSRTPARLSYTFKMNRLVPNSVLIPSSLNTLKLLNYVTILENITKLDNESGVAYFSLLSFCCLRSYHREYTGSCLKLSSVGRGSYLDG